MQVDTTPLANIKDKRMLTQLFKLSAATYYNAQHSKPDSELDLDLANRQAMTLFSLYTQWDQGDADEFENNKTSMEERK